LASSIKGVIIMSSKILLLSGAVVTYQISKTSYDKYMGSTNKDDIERY